MDQLEAWLERISAPMSAEDKEEIQEIAGMDWTDFETMLEENEFK